MQPDPACTKHTEPEKAEFIERLICINCGSSRLRELSRGNFSDNPIRAFLIESPWGESPMPHLEGLQWLFVECQDCSQMFHKRVLAPNWNDRRFTRWMSQDAIRAFEATYDSRSERFNKGRRHVTHVVRLEKMTRVLRKNEPVTLLDFGCGWGEFLAVCATFGFRAFGIDRSPARREGGQLSIFPDTQALRNNVDAPQGFHVLTMFEVLEHLDEPYDTLQALAELVVPGGFLVLETPDCTGVSSISSKSEYYLIHPLDHINAFTPKTLADMARRAGFVPAKPATVHVTGDPARLVRTEIRRLVGRFLRPTTQQYFRKV
jgi:2-polyprenyl-3-methyl-5-hydroxy-6-metoxy-1,4-benzoquinol methylase